MKKLLLLLTLIFNSVVVGQVEPGFNSDIDISEYTNAGDFLGLVNRKITILPIKVNNGAIVEDVQYQSKVNFRTNYGTIKPGEFRGITSKEYTDLLSGKTLEVTGVTFWDLDKEISAEEWNKNAEANSTPGIVKLLVTDPDNLNNFEIINGFYGYKFRQIVSEDYYKRILSLVGKEFLKGREDYKINPIITYYTPQPSTHDAKNIFTLVRIGPAVYDYTNGVAEMKAFLKDYKGDFHSFPISSRSGASSFRGNFVSKDEYEKYKVRFNSEYPKLKNEYLEKKAREEAAEGEYYRQLVEEERKLEENRKNALIKKYGSSVGTKVYNKNVELGMTRAMLFDAFNFPYESKTEMQIVGSLFESYTYMYGQTYYIISLRNGKIYSITSN